MKGKEKAFLFPGALRPGCWVDVGLHGVGQQQRQKCSDDLLIEEQKKYKRKVARAMRGSVGHLNKLLSEEMDKVRCGHSAVRRKTHRSKPWSSLSSFSYLRKLWLFSWTVCFCLVSSQSFPWIHKSQHLCYYFFHHALLHFFLYATVLLFMHAHQSLIIYFILLSYYHYLLTSFILFVFGIFWF